MKNFKLIVMAVAGFAVSMVHAEEVAHVARVNPYLQEGKNLTKVKEYVKNLFGNETTANNQESTRTMEAPKVVRVNKYLQEGENLTKLRAQASEVIAKIDESITGKKAKAAAVQAAEAVQAEENAKPYNKYLANPAKYTYKAMIQSYNAAFDYAVKHRAFIGGIFVVVVAAVVATVCVCQPDSDSDDEAEEENN